MNPREQMEAHLGLLFGDCDPDEIINMRAWTLDRQEYPLQEFFRVSETEKAIEFALRMMDTREVCVGALARAIESGRAEGVRQGRLVWVDCDDADAVSEVERFPLVPSMTVASGTEGNLHAYWVLEEPLAPDKVEEINSRLILKFGADKNCGDRARVMRLAGALNHKHEPPNPVEIVTIPGTHYGITEVEDLLDPLPRPSKPIRSSARTQTGTPSRYVRKALDKLDGVQQSGTQWKALCPAHDDNVPSLSVAEGDDGRCLVHCFAGCEYESIVDAMKLTPADLTPDSGKQSAASRLIDLARERLGECFHAPDGTTWLTVDHDGHRENWPVMSGDTERWLRQINFEVFGKGLNREAVTEVQLTLDALARFEGPEHDVFIRVAGDANSEVLVDIGDAVRTVIRIDSDGFAATSDSPVRFYRSPSATALSMPSVGGLVDELRQFVNVRDEQTMMRLAGFLLMCFHPTGPYPVLNIHGEQGSAKSTLSRMVLDLVDPHKAGLLSGSPKTNDLALVASSNHLVVLDNVSRIKPDLSDTLCRISTGGGLRTRRLYTDTDEVVLEFCRPVVVNGIGQVIKRPDLLERTAPIELAAIPSDRRLPEDEIWARWESARPNILGGLLSAVSAAIRNLDGVDLPGLPRLADWARWGEAAGPELDWEPGAFVEAIDAGQVEQVELSIDDQVEIRGLIEFMSDKPEVRLTATELLDAIHTFLEIDPAGRQGLLRRGADLSRELKVFAPALRRHGIECEFGRKGGGTRERYIHVRKS